MITRKNFIKKSAIATALTIQGSIPSTADEYNKMKKGKPKKGLVIWYSQAGHTRRYGKYIAKLWKKKGLDVKSCDYRDFDKSDIHKYDIITIGSPVYYYDVPGNFREWLNSIPEIKGIPVAAYSTFGGPGDGQHNVTCTLIEHLAAKGGVPVGIKYFGNMSTFAMTWSMGNSKRILKYKHLPNKETYSNVKDFAMDILKKTENREIAKIEKEFSFSGFMKGNPSIKFTKWMVGKHYIKKDKCIECGICEKACPVKAISIAKKKVDRKKCILCVGCVNNCPEDAIAMTFLGSKVYGFKEFLKRNKIQILDSDDL